MSKRALRRHHRARMVARAKIVQKKWWSGSDHTPEELAVQAAKIADHLKVCSCQFCGCGNPRRGYHEPRKTRQELRHALKWHLEG